MRIALVYLNNDKLVGRGVGYIAMAVRAAGHFLDFFDTVWENQTDIARTIIAGHYDLLMISATSFYARRAFSLADVVKFASKPTMPVLLGGPHATVLKGTILEQCKAIDYVCIGEGEVFVPEFLGAIMDGRDLATVTNLAYRGADGTIHVNSVRPCTDLHTLAPFDYGLFHPKSIVRDGELIPGFCYVIATRGCPYRCSYCCNSHSLDLYGAKAFLRTQKIDTVLAELRWLRDNTPAKLFYFGDEMILFDKEYAVELFTRVHDEIEMPYGCMFRTEMVTPQMVKVLRMTGCRYIAMGIECGDEQFRREYLNRHATNAQIIEAFRLCRTIPGVWITSYNMKGFPVSFDSRLTVATQRLNARVSPDHVQTTWFYPIVGTPMYDYCVARDLIDKERFDRAEDYFRQSVIKRTIPTKLDKPLYPSPST